MNREKQKLESRLGELELEARVVQLVLMRVFDRLFKKIRETKGDPQAFSCVDAPLVDLFENLTSSLALEWELGNFSHEDRLQLSMFNSELRGFLDSQQKHLILCKANASKEA